VHRLRADCEVDVEYCSKHVEGYNVMYYYRIKEFSIKLVIETSLYYDARLEKLQIMECNFFKLYGRYVSLYTYTIPVLQILKLLIMQFIAARGTTPSVSYFT
jgi:hypothetical protein